VVVDQAVIDRLKAKPDIRRQNPGAESFSELERLLRLRLELARAA